MTRDPLMDFKLQMSKIRLLNSLLNLWLNLNKSFWQTTPCPAVTKIINESGHELHCEIHSNIFRGATVATLITES